jgi:hypothetical protein
MWRHQQRRLRLCFLVSCGSLAKVSGGAGADLSEEVYDSEQHIESSRLYGNINRYAYYFTDILVGAPKPQRVSVIIDTGSSLCGFPCEGCSHCGGHIDPPFNFEASGSARWISCDVGECNSACIDGHCHYAQFYTEGSSISGYWFMDQVQLGDPRLRNPPVNVTLGCHRDERKLFYTQRVNGIMGMAPHRNSGRATLLQELFADRRHVNPDIFAMCLSEWGGELTVGGWHEEYNLNGSKEVWLDLDHAGYYSVSPSSLSLGGEPIVQGSINFGMSLVDSGTTFTYFPADVFERLTKALVAHCRKAPGCGAHIETSGCWRIDGGTEPVNFPTLFMEFVGGAVVRWPPNAYLFRRRDPGLWCHAFADNGGDPDTVLGVSWMLHKNIIFDLQADRLGVTEAICPSYKLAPGEQAPNPFTSAIARYPWLRWVCMGGWLLLSILVMTAICFMPMGRVEQWCNEATKVCSCTDPDE